MASRLTLSVRLRPFSWRSTPGTPTKRRRRRSTWGCCARSRVTRPGRPRPIRWRSTPGTPTRRRRRRSTWGCCARSTAIRPGRPRPISWRSTPGTPAPRRWPASSWATSRRLSAALGLVAVMHALLSDATAGADYFQLPEIRHNLAPDRCFPKVRMKDLPAGAELLCPCGTCTQAVTARRVRGQLDSPSPQCITIQGRDAAKRYFAAMGVWLCSVSHRWPDASEGSIGIRRPPRGDLPRSCRRAGGSATPVATEGRGGTDRNAESHWDNRWTKRAMNCFKETDMAGKVIVAVVVIAVIMAAVVMVSRQRKTQQATRAESLRSEAGEQSSLVRQRESKATEVDARARAAQAESDAKAAEAERLALAGERQKAEASKQRSEVDDQFHKADEIDPHYDKTHVGDGNTTDGTGHTHQADTSSTEDRDRETPR